ncbi:hypothetical protein PoB_005709100 [Plakobranchus ocellatus]|uniref:Uncharacterized protein n=1 Tax=Plakobranchus ocellatus TaxID=259542 RepID=A0AAV4CGS6_9GAST|nr:hypothetical protein PoB_005709100 [Plakobranchus ocellatus]
MRLETPSHAARSIVSANNTGQGRRGFTDLFKISRRENDYSWGRKTERQADRSSEGLGRADTRLTNWALKTRK